MSSTREEYSTRVLYKHPSSRAARAPAAKPAASELGSMRPRHQREAEKFGEEAKTARRHLDNKQKLRSSRAPYASFAQQEMRENDELNKNLKAKRKVLEARHADELNAAKKRHMPK
jgi:hypothetical protein